MTPVSENASLDDFWNNFGDALVVFSIPDGRLQSINHAFSQILGWTPDEVLSFELTQLFHPDDLASVKGLNTQLTLGESVEYFHVRMRHRSGEYRWLSWTLSCSNGLVYGVGRDISRRKHQEHQLQMFNDARLQLALDAGEMGAWHWDIMNDTSKWWPGMDRAHGLTAAAEVQSMESYQRFVHPDDREMLANVVGDALREKRGHRVEYRVVWPDGSVHWLEGRGQLFLDEHGNAESMAGVVMDITRRKRTEQDLQFVANASQELASLVDYRTTMDKIARLCVPDFADWCAVDMLADTGQLQRIAVAHVNPDKVALAHELHTKYPPDPTQPSGIWEVIRSGKSEMVSEITVEMLEASTTDKDYLQALKNLGLRSYIGVPIKGRDKVYGTITFITAESGRLFEQDDLNLADELARRASVAIENTILYQQLRDADRRKDEFLATLAHELRNPLVPIKNGATLLRLADYDRDKVERVMAMLERQADQLTRIVEELLDASRIATGKIKLQIEDATLQDIIHTAVEATRHRIEAGNHSLRLTLPPQPLPVKADKVRLTQVFLNLLDNAAKFTKENGRIEVSIAHTSREYVVSIMDDGLGISGEMLPRVFEMFSQEKSASQHTAGGLGIGLAVADALVKQHGGHIQVRSAGPGSGSNFEVVLPTPSTTSHASELNNASETATAPFPGNSVKRILLVEDNEDVANATQMLIESLGHATQQARTGQDALAKAADHSYDVILMDVGLPDIDGLEVARGIREGTKSARAKIIALSGWSFEQTQKFGQADIFDAAWVKPVTIEKLRDL